MGIDPGLKGGIAFLDATGLIVYPTPTITEEFVKKGKKSKRNLMDLVSLRDIIRQNNPDVGIIEKVAARSGQGVTSMFRFGTNYGEYRGIMVGLDIPFTEVHPQTWKAAFNLIKQEKDSSLELARTIWPDNAPKDFKFKKQDGLAEAALIAKFKFDNPEPI